MGEGYFTRRRGAFKAVLTVQANPSATITATSPRATYSGTANATTGLVSFEIKRKGTYTITTNNGGAYDAENNVTSVNVSNHGQAFTGQLIKINIPSSLSVGNYSSNALTAYFTRPSANWSGVNLRRNTGSAPTTRSAGTSVYTGNGNTGIVLNSTSTVTGYTNTGLTASTTYYYSIFSYLTINGVNYYTTAYKSASGTAAYYIGTILTKYATESWSVPTGWRTVQVFGVGGGGGGAGSGTTLSHGGGGGGYTKISSNISVTPSETLGVTIGAGGSGGSNGAGGNGGQTKLTRGTTALFYADGGQGGRPDVHVGVNQQSGGNGGSGGGVSAFFDSRYTSYAHNAVAGGSNGSTPASGSSGLNSTWTSGTGQGTTTKAWGSGTLYAGGGGGGGQYAYSYGTKLGAAGGSGGGGAGSSSDSQAGVSGTANTGGGGGGGFDGMTNTNGGSGGSGIMLIKCVA